MSSLHQTQFITPLTIRTTSNKSQYLELIKQQSQIGWDHLLRGKWTILWRHPQGQYKRKMNAKYKKDPIISLQKQLWNAMHQKLWRDRNNKRHGIDKKRASIATRDQLRRELSILHEQKETMQQEDQDIFFPTVDHHMEQSTLSIKNWLTCYKPLIKYSIQASAKAAQMGMKQLTTVFAHKRRTRRKRKKRRHKKSKAQPLRDTTLWDYFQVTLNTRTKHRVVNRVDTAPLTRHMKQAQLTFPDHPT